MYVYIFFLNWRLDTGSAGTSTIDAGPVNHLMQRDHQLTQWIMKTMTYTIQDGVP